MVIPEVLQTIAEITVTLAGFMGVILAFSSNKVPGSELFFRIAWTFFQCFVVVVAVLLPYVLVGFSESAHIVWGIPLLFLGVLNLLTIILGLYSIRSGPVQAVGRIYNYVLAAISFLFGVSLLLAGFDLVLPRIPEMLILGALWSTCMGAYGFVMSIKRGLDS